MFPFIPYALGALAGAAAVSLVRRGKAAVRLDKVRTRIRQATVCGLAAVEQSSAKLRRKLTPLQEPAPALADEAPPAPSDESTHAQENNS